MRDSKRNLTLKESERQEQTLKLLFDTSTSAMAAEHLHTLTHTDTQTHRHTDTQIHTLTPSHSHRERRVVVVSPSNSWQILVYVKSLKSEFDP